MVLLDLLHIQRAGYFRFLKLGIAKELSQLNINIENTRLQILPFDVSYSKQENNRSITSKTDLQRTKLLSFSPSHGKAASYRKRIQSKNKVAYLLRPFPCFASFGREAKGQDSTGVLPSDRIATPSFLSYKVEKKTLDAQGKLPPKKKGVAYFVPPSRDCLSLLAVSKEARQEGVAKHGDTRDARTHE